MHEAIGLGSSTIPPVRGGNGAIFLSKVVLVGNNECVPPRDWPLMHPLRCEGDSSNRHNFNSYVFAYYVAVGNTVRWASVFWTPPAVVIQADGSVTALNIAQDTSLEITGTTFPSVANMTLIQSQFALISETYADVSNIKIFSNYTPPVIYYRKHHVGVSPCLRFLSKETANRRGFILTVHAAMLFFTILLVGLAVDASAQCT